MAQLFPKSANALSKASIILVVVVLGLGGYFAYAMTQSDYWTRAGTAVTQPIQFSHAHHVTGLGIDCRYCHTSAESASYAGIPPTKTCMNCHQQIWTGAPMLEPVRASYKTAGSEEEKPLQWTKVHRLADFAYFDHSIHVNNGIGCSSCHGRVDQMQAVYQKGSLLMNWCLECHRAPELFVRPKDQIYTHDWDFTMAVKKMVTDPQDKDKKVVTYYGTKAKLDADLDAFAAGLPADLTPAQREARLKEFREPFGTFDSQRELGQILVKQGPVGKKPTDGYELRKVLQCSGCHR